MKISTICINRYNIENTVFKILIFAIPTLVPRCLHERRGERFQPLFLLRGASEHLCNAARQDPLTFTSKLHIFQRFRHISGRGERAAPPKTQRQFRFNSLSTSGVLGANMFQMSRIRL